MRLTKAQKELNIKVAASDLCRALEEIIYIIYKDISAGPRGREARLYFIDAVLNLFKSFKA